jgi:hypothetical protein
VVMSSSSNEMPFHAALWTLTCVKPFGIAATTSRGHLRAIVTEKRTC